MRIEQTDVVQGLCTVNRKAALISQRRSGN